MHTSVKHVIILISIGLGACQSTQTPISELQTKVKTIFDGTEGEFAMALQDLSNPENQLLINEDGKFHAASTMKVPVMIELFKQASEGKFKLEDSILVKNEFRSIVDSSTYSMDLGEDSQKGLYGLINRKSTIYNLMNEMIIRSSNLATNILIDLVDAKKVTATMRKLGAERMEVLRGVEDLKAFELGLSNSTSALDLMIIMQRIAQYEAGSKADCESMISIMKGQKFGKIIPFHLPKNVEIAHKTGSITALHHDAGIVYLPDGRAYVLVLLSKNLGDFDEGTSRLAEVSKLVYDYYMDH
jgi:beta-lactamase class A